MQKQLSMLPIKTHYKETTTPELNWAAWVLGTRDPFELGVGKTELDAILNLKEKLLEQI